MFTAHVIRVFTAVVVGCTTLAAQFQFTGVAAGDATSTEAVVWTRAVDAMAPAATPLVLAVAPNDPTVTANVSTYPTVTDPAADFTARVNLTNLQPGTKYYYRFSVGPVISSVGTFKTAPSADAATPVHFGFSGDCDGQMRPYPLATIFPTLNLDYFVFLGDTIYENASAGSPGVALSGTLPAPSATGATQAQLFADYSRKYREQFVAVNAGGQKCLDSFFTSQGNYTLLDNHELGNRQYINGGAAPGGTVGGMATGAGVDGRVATNDVNTTGLFMNKATGFQTLQQVFVNYQPLADRGLIVAPTDPRSDGTRRLYFQQQWGRNATFFNVDDRTYRDIRMKTAANADDTTSPRADNPARTMLGATQLAWLEQALLNAEVGGVTWKFVAVSSPIDQLGPIGGGLAGVGNGVGTDGGKSWIGGYRAERNALLKFIADNHIFNVVFLSTDDHQNRVNEVLYSPSGQTANAATYVPVPHCITIVDGPFGATGPDTITNHSIANIQSIAAGLVAAQAAASVDPVGLSPTYPGLHNVTREGDANADTNRTGFDFYSPDTFNVATLDVSADGKTLTVSVIGINSTAINTFGEYDAVNNPARQLLSFQIDAPTGTSDAGAGCGTGLTYPHLTADPPVLGSTIQFRVTDAAGTGTCALCFSAGLPLTTNLGSGCSVFLDLASAAPLVSVLTDASGAGAVLVPVPMDPFLEGFQITVQGVCTNAANPLGVDLTNGVFMTLGY